MVVVASLSGLGQLMEASILEILVQHTGEQYSTLVRAGAVRALGELGRYCPETRSRAWEVLNALRSVAVQALRFALVSAAERIRDEQSVPFLQSLAALQHDGLLRRRARDAARAVQNRENASGAVSGLRKDVDALVQGYRRLDARVRGLDAGQ